MKKILFLLATTIALGCNNPKEFNQQIEKDGIALAKESKKVLLLAEAGYKDEALKILEEQQKNLKSIKERCEHLINEHSFDFNDEEFKSIVDNYASTVKLRRTFKKLETAIRER